MQSVKVQKDFMEVISDVAVGKLEEDQFWLKVCHPSKGGGANEEFKVKCFKKTSGTEDKVSFEVTSINGSGLYKLLEWTEISKNRFKFAIDNGEMRCYFLKSPEVVYNMMTVDEIPCISLTSDENYVLFGDMHGNIQFGLLEKGVFVGDIDTHAHCLSVSKTLIFPSDKVGLSAGLSDRSISIWNLEECEELRCMRHQKGKITDLAILGKGRNFLSSSLDGSIVIWECGRGEVVYEFRRIKDLNDGVNVIKVRQLPEPTSNDKINTTNQSDKFFELEGKICYAGHESGVISIWDLSNQTSLKEIKSFKGMNKAVTAMCLNDQAGELYAGYADSHIVCWDYQDLENPKWSVQLKEQHTEAEFKNGETKVNDMVLLASGKVMVACGSDLLVDLDLQTKKFTFYVGYDQYDRVDALTVGHSGKSVYCVGKRSLGLKYSTK